MSLPNQKGPGEGENTSPGMNSLMTLIVMNAKRLIISVCVCVCVPCSFHPLPHKGHKGSPRKGNMSNIKSNKKSNSN